MLNLASGRRFPRFKNELALADNFLENSLDKKLLDILACPLCKGRLIFDPKHQELICSIDKLAYPIREDIPIMLVDEARRLTEQEAA